MTEGNTGKLRRPLVAGLFALIGAGLGHLYSGRIVWAVLWLLIALVIGNVCSAMLIGWNSAPLNVVLSVALGVLFLIVQIWHAVWTARGRTIELNKCKYCRWYYYLIWWLGVSVLSLVAVPIFGDYEAFKMPSAGMQATLLEDDRFIADMSAYDSSDPERGDIVVFLYPVDGVTKYIKRCMAVPGDTVLIVDKILHVNGVPAVEPATLIFADTLPDGSQRIMDRRPDGGDSRDNFGPYVMPPGAYFMLGDSRDNSYDSRYWHGVPSELILGKVVRVIYSPDWNRIGLTLE
jgi:signal peptidase I